MSNSATSAQNSEASSGPSPLPLLFDLPKAEEKIREVRNQIAALSARIMAATQREGKETSLKETAKANEELGKLQKSCTDVLQLVESMAEEVEEVLKLGD